nr:TSUP family transporter [Halomicroarcula limicola]
MVAATLAVVVGSVVFFPGAENVTRGLQSNVSGTLLALFVVVAVGAGAVKGMIGFGYSLITTPIFASVIDPTLAVVVLAIPPWMINMFQVGETDTGLEFVRREWVLLLLAVVGSVVGVTFLAEFSTGPIVPFLIGLVIFGYVLFQVFQNFVTIEGAHHPVALSVTGFLEGFLLAVANLGPLLPAYFHTFERDVDRYIGGLSMVLATIFTVRILQMVLFTDLMTTYRLWLGSVIAVVTVVGLLLGTYLRRLEFDEEKFNWFVVALLFVITLNIFRNTIPALFL